MADKIFVDGMMFKAPDENTKQKAPWIKGKISIKVPDLINFLNKHETNSGWLNIDLKKSKDGKLYLELNTWKKEDKDDLGLDEKTFQQKEEERPNETVIDPVDGREINPNDIPF